MRDQPAFPTESHSGIAFMGLTKRELYEVIIFASLNKTRVKNAVITAIRMANDLILMQQDRKEILCSQKKGKKKSR